MPENNTTNQAKHEPSVIEALPCLNCIAGFHHNCIGNECSCNCRLLETEQVPLETPPAQCCHGNKVDLSLESAAWGDMPNLQEHPPTERPEPPESVGSPTLSAAVHALATELGIDSRSVASVIASVVIVASDLVALREVALTSPMLREIRRRLNENAGLMGPLSSFAEQIIGSSVRKNFEKLAAEFEFDTAANQAKSNEFEPKRFAFLEDKLSHLDEMCQTLNQDLTSLERKIDAETKARYQYERKLDGNIERKKSKRDGARAMTVAEEPEPVKTLPAKRGNYVPKEQTISGRKNTAKLEPQKRGRKPKPRLAHAARDIATKRNDAEAHAQNVDLFMGKRKNQSIRRMLLKADPKGFVSFRMGIIAGRVDQKDLDGLKLTKKAVGEIMGWHYGNPR